VDVISWLAVVSGVISILAFLFAVWVWLRSDIKVRELTATVQALHDIADSVIWEGQVLPGEDASARLTQLEKSIGLVSAMRTLSSRYVGDQQNYRATELGELVQRGIIWSNDMLTKLETSSEVREVWLITHDLEPDMSQRKTGAIVQGNLAAGKSYIYFYPAELKGAEEKVLRLQRNIGADHPKRATRVTYIPVRNVPGLRLFSNANMILFFKDKTTYGTDLVFQELVLTKIAKRGLFWQEHDRDHAAALFDMLRREMASVERHRG
jgi:HAMP domain-containing protein